VWAAALAAVLLLTPVPAYAQGEVKAEGVVYAGLYPSGWEAAADLEAMASWAGKRVTFAGIFHGVDVANPERSGDALSWWLEQAWRARATPFVNVGMDVRIASVARGDHDHAIRVLAAQLRSWLAQGGGRSLILAPFPEMNTNWVPYGMDPYGSREAFRRLRRIFQSEGLNETQVRWAFAPNNRSTSPYRLTDYYPGDAYVDLIGISAFNFGPAIQGRWLTAAETIGGTLDELRSFVPHKPYLIAQTGTSSSGGDKNAWVRNLFALAAADPNVVGLIYFNFDKETDWPVWDGRSGSLGWQEGLQAAAVYQWPLTEWFQPGPLPFRPEAVPPSCPGSCDSVTLAEKAGWLQVHGRAPWSPSTSVFSFGNPGDLAVMGDWDCDGEGTPGVYRPGEGLFYLRNTNTAGPAELSFAFGHPSDLPLVGDWDGDGCDTVALFRPPEARFYVSNVLGRAVADLEFDFGQPGDMPFAGDFDGDGVDTVGVYRPGEGRIYLRNTLATGPPDLAFLYGQAGDQILAGDWDGDGIDTPAVYRRGTGQLALRLSNTQGAADYTLNVGRSWAVMAVARPAPPPPPPPPPRVAWALLAGPTCASEAERRCLL
jgi:hypothetical protein